MYKDSKLRKRHGFGSDEISLNSFKANADLYIKDLSVSLRKNSYTPNSLLPHLIPKPSGSDRVICVPTVHDRLVQRALIQYLHTKGYGFENSISYGFVKNRSVSEAAMKAIEYRKQKPWAYKADISSFFDSINRDILVEQVRKKIRLTTLHPIITSIINTEIYSHHSGVKKRIKKLGIVPGIGLRQGMPASPYLANLMLFEFDKEIEKMRIPMVRYADDLIAFGNSEKECKEIHEKCVELLAKEGLNIHPIAKSSKTMIAEPSEPIEFLGLSLSPDTKNGYSLIVADKQLNAIKQKILELGDLDHCIKQGISISKLTRKVDDSISGYLGAYSICNNTEQLEQTINSAKSLAMSRLFVDQFGIDFKSLTNKQKQFLELT